MKAPIFIMGTQRSGTTLLARILSAHPAVFIQNELDLPRIFGKGLNKNEIINSIAKQIKGRGDYLLEDKLINNSDFIWGLKDPQLTEHISELRQFLPDTKFIIIVRDGRGVANSYIENKWGLGTNVYCGARRWKREVEEQESFMSEAPESFLILRYEDLIIDLEGAMHNVCDFLDIEFDSILMTYDKENSYIKTTRESMNSYNKPNRELAEKWKKRLSLFEVSVIETVAGDLLKKYNYSLIGHTVKLSKIRVFYYKLHQRIVGEIQIQYRWRKVRWRVFLKRLMA